MSYVAGGPPAATASQPIVVAVRNVALKTSGGAPTGFPTQTAPAQASALVHSLPSSHAPLSTMVVLATGVLFAGLGSLVEDDTAALPRRALPLPAHQSTLTTIVKLAVPLAARVATVHVTGPIAPTAGFVQLHPAGAAIETNVALAGIAVASCTFDAAPGPLSVTPSAKLALPFVGAETGPTIVAAKSAFGTALHVCIVQLPGVV